MRHNSDSPWTEEKVTRLRHLWVTGLRTAAIGVDLGMSKNAIVGKAHRLGFPPRPSPIVRDATDKTTRLIRRAPPRLADLMPSATLVAGPPATQDSTIGPTTTAERSKPFSASPKRTAITDPPPATRDIVRERPYAEAEPTRGDGTCCWPIGHPGTPAFRFCDKPHLPGRPYCPEHATIAYLPPPRRQAPAAPDNVFHPARPETQRRHAHERSC